MLHFNVVIIDILNVITSGRTTGNKRFGKSARRTERRNQERIRKTGTVHSRRDPVSRCKILA